MTLSRYLEALEAEAGGHVGPHGLASICFASSVAVVPQELAVPVLLGKWAANLARLEATT